MKLRVTKYLVNGSVETIDIEDATFKRLLQEIGAERGAVLDMPCENILLVNKEGFRSGKPLNPKIVDLRGRGTLTFGDALLINRERFLLL